MPYTHTNYTALKTQLAARLDDSGKVYWSDAELLIYIHESLRTFGLASAFWRERASFNTVSGTAFYDIVSQLPTQLGATVTDRDLVKVIQYHLLESTGSQSVWGGTEMFTLAQIGKSIERRRNQFLADTELILTRTTPNVPAPPAGRVVLDDSIIKIKRLAWKDVDGRYYRLWLSDEFALTSKDTSWSINPDVPPVSYSVLSPPPITIQLSPPPSDVGTLEIISVNTGAALDPATANTVLGIPDGLCWIVKWGALADLLGADGPARDPIRAQYCEQAYQFGVSFVKQMSSVVHAQINGVSTLVTEVDSLDSKNPKWQSVPGTPKQVAMVGWNILGVSPMPDGIYSITLDVVRNAPISSDGDAFVELGREQLDGILDYAEHLAAFKMGGGEFMSTQRQAQNFLITAMAYNSRLNKQARYLVPAKYPAENKVNLGTGASLGALPVNAGN